MVRGSSPLTVPNSVVKSPGNFFKFSFYSENEFTLHESRVFKIYQIEINIINITILPVPLLQISLLHIKLFLFLVQNSQRIQPLLVTLL